MKTLIVAATRFEIQDTIPLLEEKQIPFLITGVGMTATAYSLGKALAKDDNHFDIVINVGIAGAIDRTLNLGEVVDVQSDCFYELGAEDGNDFLPIEELGFAKGNFVSTISQSQANLMKVNAITVNKVHGNQLSIEKIQQRLPDTHIETMEGAAVFFVCEQESIACIQIRSISNYVERRNRSAWQIDLAIENLNTWLRNYVLANY
ncbi:futalosine hydrolase [Sphingobacterium bovistauri]|uniref:Futalosine hydrolase n=1 Tax=Sphingobacterium bovistauri TaxID=2781959 RepID=A0ABS7Z8Z6_9SPHI|nr:futalosine hydrolase [Sphingobacterium bovistauri]MCA5006666.1 futalosine hydrolase [Sphingobacterium bovistauri]